MMMKDENEVIVTGNSVEYTIVPNLKNEHLRLRILEANSPAFGFIIEINSVETVEVNDYLSLKLGFEMIDPENEVIVTHLYDELNEEDKGLFVLHMGDAFVDIIMQGIGHLLEKEDPNVST
jgi:hypothetical protein